MLHFMEENASEIVDALKVLTGGMNFWSILIGIACYILMSLGLYSLASRRIISRPWLAWIPVGKLWILGCLADQYRRTVGGKEKSNSGDRLFWLSLIAVALMVAIVVLLGFGLSYVSDNAPIKTITGDEIEALNKLPADELPAAYLELMVEMLEKDPDVTRTVNIGLIGLSILIVCLTVALIWLAVEEYKALYFLYASSLPKYAVWFLIPSIVLGLEAVFVFICRKQHQGLPHDKKGRLQVL